MDNLQRIEHNEPARSLNPYGAAAAQSGEGGIVAVAQSREIAEVQAAVAMARRLPRDPRAAMNRILDDCTRPTLANAALYAYQRGNEIVSGPSIRLAEAIARAWGNLAFGIRELSQDGGVSQVEAFCWDLETNTRASKVFQVKHQRKAKGAIRSVDDPRDVYELVANLGARRMRACILAIIPSDVVEAAVAQCEMTQTNEAGAPEEQIAAMVAAFEKLGVTRDMIAKRLGHKPEASRVPEVLNLRRIYKSIEDGIAKVADFFASDEPEAPDRQAVEIGEKLRARARGTAEQTGGAP